MSIDISYYQLQPMGGSYRHMRQGALIRLTTKEGGIGYGDCHPWHELGDFELKKQLALLATGKLTPLTQRTIAAAQLDASARKTQKHLFATLKVPPSHHHLAELSSSQGHNLERLVRAIPSVFKIKVGIDPKHELAILQQWWPVLRQGKGRLRLDFNCRLTRSDFETYLQALGDVRDCIDFYEDPCVYDPQQWQQLREKYGVVLACDRESLRALPHPHSCDVLVVKPAVQDVGCFLGESRAGRQLVITSYVDHPIGQLTAAHAAAVVFRDEPEALGLCGLLTHHAFAATPFSMRFGEVDGCLIPSSIGVGWGYDDLWETLPWQPLLKELL